jgi:hypothetical protein
MIDGFVRVVRSLQRALQRLPFACRDKVIAHRRVSALQPFLRLEILSMRSATRGPKALGLFLHRLESLAQAHDAGARRKQHLADIVLCLQDLLATSAQTLVVETEHPRVESAIGPCKKWCERALARWNGQVILGEERVFGPFTAANFKRIASLF